MAYSDMFSYNIGLLGPSGIGKTSLLTSIILQMQSFQQRAGLSCNIYPSTADTERKIRDARGQFDRAVSMREFTPIPGSSESMKFEVRFEMTNGDCGERLDIDFVDYRGGDLLKDFSDIERSDWYRKMMASKDLFLPIDAVTVMEYVRTRDAQMLGTLSLERICEIIQKWVAQIKDDAPYTIAFVPIKTETYVARGQMNELKQAIHDLYYSPVCSLLSAKRNLIVQYNPVETYGCVVLDSTEWDPPSLIQHFKIVRDSSDQKVVPHISGAANLMLAIFRKRFAANLNAFERRIRELNLKLDVKNPILRWMIEHLPIVRRGVKDELARLIAKKEYYGDLVAQMMTAFDSSHAEIWKEMEMA